MGIATDGGHARDCSGHETERSWLQSVVRRSGRSRSRTQAGLSGEVGRSPSPASHLLTEATGVHHDAHQPPSRHTTAIPPGAVPALGTVVIACLAAWATSCGESKRKSETR